MGVADIHPSTNILREPEFNTCYEPAVYEPSASNPLSPHKLAVVLMVLTLETFLDVTGDEYVHISSAPAHSLGGLCL